MNRIASSSGLAARARAADPDRYLCALFAPPRPREALFALILFNAEIARVREAVSEAMLGRIRLQWWREVIDEIYAKKERVREHEVVGPLAEAIRAYALGRDYFERLIDAREADLEDAAPESMAALEKYAEESAAPLIALGLEIAGAEADRMADLCRDIGIGWALTGLLRALPHHAARGRVMMPREVLAEAGLTVQAVLGGGERRRVTRAVAKIAAVARRHLQAARAPRRALSGPARRATLPAVLAGAYLDRLARCAHDPYHGRAVIGPLRRQLLLSRAAFLGLG